MAGGRHAWCPRCDEVRRARPGSACATCSARLVRLPHLAGSAGWLGGPAALLQQARSWLPALRAVAAGAVLLALLAGAFVAGRSSSPASAAPAAPATTTPSALGVPGGRLRVPSGNAMDFGWSALHGTVSVTLRAIFAAGDGTNLIFDVAGVERGWVVEGVGDMRVLDGQGRELIRTGLAQDVFGSPRPAREDALVTVQLGRRIDPNSVARVSVGRLLLVQQQHEHLSGTLVDADLKRRLDQSQPGQVGPASPASCPSCRLQVRCDECQTIRMAGAAYRHGQVALLLAPAGRAAGESLVRGDVVVSGASGQIGSLDTTLDSGDTVVTFEGRDLAATTDRGQGQMSFEVTAMLNRLRVVQGPWQLDQHSGSR